LQGECSVRRRAAHGDAQCCLERLCHRARTLDDRNRRLGQPNSGTSTRRAVEKRIDRQHVLDLDAMHAEPGGHCLHRCVADMAVPALHCFHFVKQP
jgi:hypothetical protein